VSPKTANIVIVFFNLVGFLLVGYAINDFITVNSAISARALEIPYDSGTYYLFLIAIFWIFTILHWSGILQTEHKLKRYSSTILVAGFACLLILANGLNYYVSHHFESAGYIECDDPTEISRISKGESSIYRLNGC